MPQLSNDDLKYISEHLARAVEIEKKNKRLVEALTLASQVLAEIPAAVAKAVAAVKVETKEPKVTVMPANVTVPKPEVTVNVPKQEPAVVNVPKPEVTVNVPKQPAPNVKVTMPTKALTNEIRAVKKAIHEAMSVQQEALSRDVVFPEYTAEKPMKVMMVNTLGKPWEPLIGARAAVAQMIRNEDGRIAKFGPGTANDAIRVVHASDASQSVSVSGFTASVAVSIQTDDGDSAMDEETDSVRVIKAGSPNATTTAVTVGSDASTNIVPTSATRKSIVIAHTSSSNLYISTGTASSATTLPLVANQIYGFDDYIGPINAILEESGGTTAVRYIEIA